MPINYVRRLTGRKRTASANRHLGFALAFVAGAINAGGFLAVQQYTSHMTGIVSSMADSLVLGAYDVVLGGSDLLGNRLRNQNLAAPDDGEITAVALKSGAVPSWGWDAESHLLQMQKIRA